MKYIINKTYTMIKEKSILMKHKDQKMRARKENTSMIIIILMRVWTSVEPLPLMPYWTTMSNQLG
jgi:hypothetical protein